MDFWWAEFKGNYKPKTISTKCQLQTDFINLEFQMNKVKPRIIETEINSPNIASLLRLIICSSSPQNIPNIAIIIAI
jgi:hypothetical protein